LYYPYIIYSFIFLGLFVLILRSLRKATLWKQLRNFNP